MAVLSADSESKTTGRARRGRSLRSWKKIRRYDYSWKTRWSGVQAHSSRRRPSQIMKLVRVSQHPRHDVEVARNGSTAR